ncbi:MAG: SIMPL domain-containing protein [Candidatus Micrarchaeota archaeon]
MKECCEGGDVVQGHGKMSTMFVLSALLLALGMIGGGYMLSKGDYSPNIYSSATPNEHDITVSATATKKVAPDLLQIRMSVETEAVNANDAQAQNAQVTNELFTKLKNLGIPEDKIQTVSYRVDTVQESNRTCDANGYNCRWTYKNVGYKVTHRVDVEVEQLDKGGSVIDAASSTGVNQTFVDSVYYTLKETTRSELAKTLLQEASAAAKAKAQRIADGLGISLGKVLSASESYVSPYYSNSYKSLTYAAEDMAGASETVLSPGEVDMSASVSVAYEVSN